MSWKEDFAHSIRQLVGADILKDKPNLYYATVNEENPYDIDARTCNITLESGKSDINITSAFLMSDVSDGMLHLPSAGSTVVVAKIANGDPFIIMFSQLDKIFYVAGDFTLLIWSGGLEFAGKKYGGIPFISNPDDSSAGLLKKLNNLENMLNDLATKFNNHTHPVAGVTAGSASVVSAITTTPETNTLTPTQKADIENPLVQHGDNT